jgi:hypothetical protein
VSVEVPDRSTETPVSVRLLAALLAATLAIAACGGDDTPEPEEPDPVPEVEPEPEPEPEEEEEEPEDTRPRSPYTGLPIDEELLERPLLIAKIENSPQSRPQSGLDAADIVYEEVVEAGITRFFVLFHSQLPDRAGPIRSARPVDTELLGGYGPSAFAYSGARAEVQSMLAGTPTVNVTEGFAGFERDGSRRAPHNLYIRPADTLEGAIQRNAEPFGDIGWVFDDEPPAGEVACPEPEEGQETAVDCEDPGGFIDIRMSNAYRTQWEYDEDEGLYRRYQDGNVFEVADGDTIGAANVVVLATRHYVGDTGYPETSVVTDDRRAVVLRDGKRYEARWAKPTASDELVILTEDGEPFPLKPGPTWLHLPSEANMPGTLDPA